MAVEEVARDLARARAKDLAGEKPTGYLFGDLDGVNSADEDDCASECCSPTRGVRRFDHMSLVDDSNDGAASDPSTAIVGSDGEHVGCDSDGSDSGPTTPAGAFTPVTGTGDDGVSCASSSEEDSLGQIGEDVPCTAPPCSVASVKQNAEAMLEHCTTFGSLSSPLF